MSDTKQFIDLTVTPGEKGREDTQGCWQTTVASFFRANPSWSILDVGAGLGRSKQRFHEVRSDFYVTTQDRAPVDVDIHEPIERIPSQSYDIVTSFDVIEHLKEVDGFAAELVRVARKFVCLTTPNRNCTGNAHIYHWQEYTPSEMLNIMKRAGSKFFYGWLMPPDGRIVEVPQSDLVRDRDCLNFCLVMIMNSYLKQLRSARPSDRAAEPQTDPQSGNPLDHLMRTAADHSP